MSGATYADHPVRQQVLRDLPPRRSPLTSFVMTIVVALATCSIALPAAALADPLPATHTSDATQSGTGAKAYSIRPQTDETSPIPDHDAPTTIEVRPERTIVRDVDEALPLILVGHRAAARARRRRFHAAPHPRGAAPRPQSVSASGPATAGPLARKCGVEHRRSCGQSLETPAKASRSALPLSASIGASRWPARTLPPRTKSRSLRAAPRQSVHRAFGRGRAGPRGRAPTPATAIEVRICSLEGNILPFPGEASPRRHSAVRA